MSADVGHQAPKCVRARMIIDREAADRWLVSAYQRAWSAETGIVP